MVSGLSHWSFGIFVYKVLCVVCVVGFIVLNDSECYDEFGVQMYEVDLLPVCI